MAGSGASLKLVVEVEGQKPSLHELKPNEGLMIGRKAGVDIQIARSSISLEHLKIVWTGHELRLKDMGSKFGTFRLPQDSPFTEASFPGAYAPVELRLSKSKIKLSWKTGDFVSEPTEVVAPTNVKTQAKDPAPKAAKAPMKFADEPSVSPSAAKIELESYSREPGAETALPPRVAAKVAKTLDTHEWFQASTVILYASLLIFGVSVGLGMLQYQGIIKVPRLWLENGGAIDFVAIWVHQAVKYLALEGLLFFVGVTLAFRFLRRARRGEVAFLKRFVVSRQMDMRVRVQINMFLGMAFFVAAFLWPGLWGMRFGLPPNFWPKALKLYNETTSPLPPDADAAQIQKKITELKALEAQFMGSSLLYKALFEDQRARILKECGGVGDNSPWDSKKICLVMLFASAVETREEVHPALLQDVSSRAAILLSLDGITRVLVSEGPSAPMIPFFLDSLDLVNLGREREKISQVLASAANPGASKEIVTTLKELRKWIDNRFDERQNELAFPSELRLRIPGPLELGI